MRADFTDEQKVVMEAARKFAKEEAAALNREMDRHGPSDNLIEGMKKSRLLGIPFPKEYGGWGSDAVSCALALYELAARNAACALTLDVHWLGAEAVMTYGTEEQKRKYLTRAADSSIFAFSLTEPGAGSDAAALQATAEAAADGYVLNGMKSWCTNAGIADLYVIMVKTDKDAGAKGISAFIVEGSNPGLKVGKEEDKMGMRGTRAADIELTDCRVSKDALLGKEGAGFRIAMTSLDGARISVGAIASGMSEAALNVSRSFARERVAFGAPIAELQAVQFKIADIAIGLEASLLMTLDAARKKAAGERHTKEAAMVKTFASSHAVKSALEAIQIHGARGYSRDYPAEQLLRDAKMLEIGEGTNEVLRMIIGRTILS